MTKVLVNLDLNGNQILALRCEMLAADPSGGGLYEGRLWINSTTHILKYYDGTSIVPITLDSIDSLTVDAATIENTGTSLNPSIRVKAGGIGVTQLSASIPLSTFTAPAADVPFATHKITGLGDPTTAQDAATKAYVDQTASLLAWKYPCVCATTGDITLSGTQTIDGHSAIAGQRVLVRAQTNGIENGIYVCAAGAWSRSTDADSSTEFMGSLVVGVLKGTLYAQTYWTVLNDFPVLNTDVIFWLQFGNPMTTTYDLLMQGANGVSTRLPKGSNNTVLFITSGGVLQYALLTDANIAAGAGIALSKLATDPLARANHTGTQLAATISDFDTQVRLSRLDQMAAPTADVSLNSHKLTSVTDPTSAQDAATKAYVDAVASGVDWKASVRAATTAAITLSAPQTVDGVAVIAGDRVLVKNQGGTASNLANGIYVVAAGAWTRAADADASSEVTGGLATFVSEGTINGNTAWVLTTDDAIVLGTTALTFTQFGSPGAYTAGTGLTLTGMQFALDVPVAVANGGTAATTLAGAKTSLGFMTRQAFNWVSGTSTACTHNLGTLDVIVQVYEVSTGAQVIADVVLTSTNVVTVTVAVTQANGFYRIIVIG